MAACEKCGGIGVIEKEDRLYECLCAYLRRRAAEMAPYIRKAPVNSKHLELPIIELTDKLLYVISPWADMKAIIKIVMIKNPKKYIRITSDREIRDVFVGATSRAARGDDEEQAMVFNTLQDLMDIPDLVIVRLNEMHYKNKAAPGALVEAVSFRADRDKPTWMISDTDRPFTNNSHAWSESMAELLSSGFVKTVIPRILPKNVIEDTFMTELLPPQSDLSVASPGLSEGQRTLGVSQPPLAPSEPEKPKKSQRKAPSGPSEETSGLAMYGSGLDKPRFGRSR
jgi:hypothetical protein